MAHLRLSMPIGEHLERSSHREVAPGGSVEREQSSLAAAAASEVLEVKTRSSIGLPYFNSPICRKGDSLLAWMAFPSG